MSHEEGPVRSVVASVQDASATEAPAITDVPSDCLAQSQRPPIDPILEPTIIANDFGFQPCGITIPADQPVTLTVVNDGFTVGNVAIDELGIRSEDITSGGIATVVVDAPEGEYVFSSDVPGQAIVGRIGIIRALSPAASASQEGTAETRPEIPVLLQRWAAAWATGNNEQLAATLSNPTAFEDIPTGSSIFGDPAALIDAFNDGKQELADVDIRLSDGFIADDRAAATGVFSARYVGQIEGIPPGEGQYFGLRFAAVFELQDGRITSTALYYDLNEALVTLGGITPPESSPPSILLSDGEHEATLAP